MDGYQALVEVLKINTEICNIRLTEEINKGVFMLEKLQDYFLSEPKALIYFGRAFVWLGGWLIIFALVGMVATTAINAMGNIGRQAISVKTLADIYPSIPTWWIAESIIGALPAIVIVVAGLWMNQTGKRIWRFMR